MRFWVAYDLSDIKVQMTDSSDKHLGQKPFHKFVLILLAFPMLFIGTSFLLRITDFTDFRVGSF